MDEYTEIPHSSGTRRIFVLREMAKCITIFPFIIAIGSLYNHDIAGGYSTIGFVSFISGVVIGFWAFLRPNLCPYCKCRMRVQKNPSNGNQSLFLVCDKCRGYIKLNMTEPNP